MIAIIDYDAGNIRSVEKALITLGEQPVVTREKNTILAADKLILPGVGAFGDAMERLHQYGLVDVIREAVKNGTPLLGICLGLQLLFEHSDESDGVKGLGILKGQIPGDKTGHKAVCGNLQWSLCIFCSFLLFKSRGSQNRGGHHGVQHSYSCCSRAGQCVCLPVPPGKEQ